MEPAKMPKLEIGMQDSNNWSSRCVNSRRHIQGFTLIEILVVIVIIGVTLGFAVMSFGDFGKERKIIAAAEELAQFLTLVHEKALLESSTLKLQLNAVYYGVERLSPQQQWQAINSSAYQHRTFPSGTQIDIAKGSQKSHQLMVIFDSSGDITPFILYIGTLQHPHLIKLEGHSNGRILYQSEAHP